MSLSFPELKLPTCLGWNFAKRMRYSSVKQTPQSQRRAVKSTVQQSVVFELELTYEFLKSRGITYDDDMAYLEGFYEACRGGYGLFLFDPSLYNLDSMSVVQDVNGLRGGFFGLGDGSKTTFQLWRSTAALGGDPATVTLVEMIQYTRFPPPIYVNGLMADPSTYSIANYPTQVTFNTAPANGAVLSWEGTYIYLCEFAENELQMEEFMYQLWELKSLKINTVLL